VQRQAVVLHSELQEVIPLTVCKVEEELMQSEDVEKRRSSQLQTSFGHSHANLTTCQANVERIEVVEGEIICQIEEKMNETTGSCEARNSVFLADGVHINHG
jgi:phosphoglycerate-specific signal transduction histidine kinase